MGEVAPRDSVRRPAGAGEPQRESVGHVDKPLSVNATRDRLLWKHREGSGL